MKVLLLGQSGVGKSSLMLRFSSDSFNPEQVTTIGVDFRVRPVDVGAENGGTVNVQVWDTAGQERFRTLTSSYYRGAHGIIFVHDATSEATLENVRHWLDEAEAYCAGRDVVKLLVTNKVDLLAAFEEEEAQRLKGVASDFARSQRMLHFFCSAKTSEGVQAAFREVALRISESEGFKQAHEQRTSLLAGAHGGAGGCSC
jgi:Ras-related protein Rab-18